MANLNDLKAQAQETITKKTQPANDEVIDLPVAPEAKPIAQGVWGEILESAEYLPDNQIFMGLVGPEGTGKTGIVLDSLTDEEIANGDVIFVLDFDGGGQTIRATHHRAHPKNIRVLNPNVMQTGESRDSFDYPATHRRVMNIGRTLVNWAADPGNKPNLHSVLITGLDQWDAVATNCMFIEDLGTAPDGIGAKVKPHEQIGMRFNWQIRSTRFHQLTAICKTLMSLGVRVYVETHFKDIQDKSGAILGKKAAWEKNMAGHLNQILWFHKSKVRNDENKPTGEIRYEVEFVKCRTNPALLDQRRLVMRTQKDGSPDWYGLPELKEGQV
ncbi:MAG: hypothetical protein HOC79_05595 [Euryarchaeota archaeon]|jgi:hypothetical protein|nr:hypothetical protein [Euryarchaeota archaeon]